MLQMLLRLLFSYEKCIVQCIVFFIKKLMLHQMPTSQEDLSLNVHRFFKSIQKVKSLYKICLP
jgi:hypothetical protein